MLRHNGCGKRMAPTYAMTCDEDDNCLERGIFMGRVCPPAWLTAVPNTVHAVNVEEPVPFNRPSPQSAPTLPRDTHRHVRWTAQPQTEVAAQGSEKSRIEFLIAICTTSPAR